MKSYIVLLCKKCSEWPNFNGDVELSHLLELRTGDLEYEKDADGEIVKRGICMQHILDKKQYPRELQLPLRAAIPNDYFLSPKSLQNVHIEGRFGCCGLVGDIEENAPFNIFCYQGHEIGIETSDCLSDFIFARIPSDRVVCLSFDETEISAELEN